MLAQMIGALFSIFKWAFPRFGWVGQDSYQDGLEHIFSDDPPSSNGNLLFTGK